MQSIFYKCSLEEYAVFSSKCAEFILNAIEALYAKAAKANCATLAMSIESRSDLVYAHLELRYDTSKALPSVITEK